MSLVGSYWISAHCPRHAGHPMYGETYDHAWLPCPQCESAPTIFSALRQDGSVLARWEVGPLHWFGFKESGSSSFLASDLSSMISECERRRVAWGLTRAWRLLEGDPRSGPWRPPRGRAYFVE